jgi:4-amino-4-deoxy-L-arabinose transferase
MLNPLNPGKRLQTLALAVLVLVYALAFQGARPLYSPDEGRYTDVALAMLEDGDWMRPMVNDEFEHWSKPPLTYWSIAASIAVFGRNEFAARLPSALAFAFTIGLLLTMGRRFAPRQPALPALIYATFLFPAMASNQVTTDSLLTLWETAQIAAFACLWWSVDPIVQRRARLLLWLAAALAFLTKGPPGLLLLLASVTFAVSSAGWRGLPRIIRWDGAVLFLIVAGTWFGFVILRQPDLLHYFLVDEVIDRVASSKFHRNGEWYGAIKVYLPVLVLGTLPWLAIASRRLWQQRARMLQHIRESGEARLLACWIILPLLVFAISRSRLPLYILPVFVPIALALARMLQPLRLDSGTRRWTLALWCIALVTMRIIPAHLQVADDDRRLAIELRDRLPAAPDEILFVDTAPRYGLRFYLRSEVERVRSPNAAYRPESEKIASEMRVDEGCRVLLGQRRDAKTMASDLAASQIDFRRLADLREYAVFAQITARCPAYAVLARAAASTPLRKPKT